jgi:hypothetical protein
MRDGYPLLAGFLALFLCACEGGSKSEDPSPNPTPGLHDSGGGQQCSASLVTGSEQCVPTAFRFDLLALRDPHAFASIFGCNDITSNVNDQIDNRIKNDTKNPPDGFLDVSLATVFRPLAQSSPSTPIELHFAKCTAPIESTTCKPGTEKFASNAHSQASGTCLKPMPGTLHGYSPAPSEAAGPCFVTDPETIDVDIVGLKLSLKSAQIGATYVGSPADGLDTGLLMGFLSEDDADNIILPANLPVVGGKPLSSVLRGGKNNCKDGSDKSTFNGVSGWWMYLDFTAKVVPWTD